METKNKETKFQSDPGSLAYGRYQQVLNQALFYNSVQAIAILDATGYIAEANPAFIEMFEYSANELSDLFIEDLIDPAFKDVTKKNRKSLTNGKSESFELESICRRKNGSSFWGEFNVMAIPGHAETPSAIIAIINDISDKKEIQNALQERDEMVRALYDRAAHAIASTNDLGRFVEVNLAFEKMFGYSREEVLNLTNLDITAPEWVEVSREKANAMFRGEITGYRLEKKYQRKDGSTFWGELSVRALTQADGSMQSVAVIVDISDRKKAEDVLQREHDELEQRVKARTTELAESNAALRVEIANRAQAQEALKKSEERLRAIFETATDQVFIKDSQLRYRLVNPCMEALFELPAEQIVGLTDKDLFGGETSRHLRQVDQRVLGGETIEEVHSRKVKGNLMTFFDNRSPMHDNNGNIVGICGISRDITERTNPHFVSDDTEYDYPSSAMRGTLIQVQNAAKTEAIILLTGESGSGKDHLARYIHKSSSRANGPFYSINCGAIPSDLAESELFGHERGAFTGATRKKRGIFELAEGGTVLLNEIGELSLPLQVKLLTFLDTFTFTRVGGEKKIVVNARLLAATNRNLEQEVASGRFREDLFYRLNVFPIKLPPLRERIKDIPIIAQRIIGQLGRELQLPYRPKIEPQVMAELLHYPWPGNVRELKNAIERAIILSGGTSLGFDFLDPDLCLPSEDTWSVPFPPQPSLNSAVSELKKNFVLEALKRSNGMKGEAARILGISRFALLRQIKKHIEGDKTAHFTEKIERNRTL